MGYVFPYNLQSTTQLKATEAEVNEVNEVNEKATLLKEPTVQASSLSKQAL